MPIYEYEHLEEPCSYGQVFEYKQVMRDFPLRACPNCGGPVQKLISRTFAHTPKTNSELRDLGFTKLVRRDDGIYENVTAREGENRYMDSDKPETFPHLHKTIRD